MRRERIVGCDFIRAIAALGIIIFHFYCHSQNTFKPLLYHANGDFGLVFVTIFFILSGAMCYYNYNLQELNIKKFFYKRWKSIFPLFYVAYAYFYIQRVFETGKLFWNGKPLLLVQTLLGMDGYIHYRFWDNYFILGEWFLGAIIILYIVYPALLWCFEKNTLLTTLLLGIVYAIVTYIYVFNPQFFLIEEHCNPISYVLSFEIGMLLMKYRTYINKKPVIILNLILCIIILFVKMPIHKNVLEQILGCGLFCILWNVGNSVMKNRWIASTITYIGDLSYAIFLIQHVLILKVLSVTNPVENSKSMLVLLITILFIVLTAKIITIVTDAIMNSMLIKKIDNRILKRN